MTQTLIPINLPIRLQCLRVPVEWHYETVKDKSGSETVWFTCRDLRDESVTAFDPWEKRAEFFRLKEGDSDALLEFLKGIGMFTRSTIGGALLSADDAQDRKAIEAMQENYRIVDAADGGHEVWGEFLPTSVDAIWSMRKVTIREMEAPRKGLGFDVSPFEAKLTNLRSGPAAVITTLSFQEALAAAVRIDHLQRAKIRRCQRADCGIPHCASHAGVSLRGCGYRCSRKRPRLT